MSGGLRVTRKPVPPSGVLLELAGSLDEHADLDGLGALDAQEVTVELAGLRRINSVGIHRWVQLLERLTATRRVTLAHLSPEFLAQALMVPNMVARATVASAALPYWCPECQRMEEHLARSAAEVRRPRACRECDAELEPDFTPALAELLAGGAGLE